MARKPKRKRWYKCPACEQRQLHWEGRHYCKCNAVAPFRMDLLIVLNIVNKMGL